MLITSCWVCVTCVSSECWTFMSEKKLLTIFQSLAGKMWGRDEILTWCNSIAILDKLQSAQFRIFNPEWSLDFGWILNDHWILGGFPTGKIHCFFVRRSGVCVADYLLPHIWLYTYTWNPVWRNVDYISVSHVTCLRQANCLSFVQLKEKTLVKKLAKHGHSECLDIDVSHTCDFQELFQLGFNWRRTSTMV